MRTSWSRKDMRNGLFLFLRVMKHDQEWSCTTSSCSILPQKMGATPAAVAFQSGKVRDDVVAGALDTMCQQRGFEPKDWEIQMTRDVLTMIEGQGKHS